MKTIAFLIFLSVALSGCYPSKYVNVLSKRAPLPNNTIVHILGVGQTLPADAQLVGQLYIGAPGVDPKYCTYDEVVHEALQETLNMGGNVFQITEHGSPGQTATQCHTLKGDVYFLETYNRMHQ